jgi:lipid-A-disaccharide synthase
MTRLLVSAGEPSGDLHAASVVRALRTLDPGVSIDAVGGDALAAAGVHILAPVDRLAAVGTVESAASLPRHWALLRRLDTHLAERRYDAVLLVDYPGFHLRVAHRAARYGVPVVYYIAPQLWAWGAWRLRRLRADVRHLAVILPFEERYFRDRGVACTFVGHPLLDRPDLPTGPDARRALALDADAPVLALFPGSRIAEHHRLWRPFRETAARMRDAIPGLSVVVAAPRTSQLVGAEGMARTAHAPLALAAADVALCKSGTVTLEAALAETPLVVAYRLHPVTFGIARRLVRVPAIGLVNLIAGSGVAPEFIQGAVTPDALSSALRPLLERDGEPARSQRAAFRSIRARLGSPGAGQRVAELLLRHAA